MSSNTVIHLYIPLDCTSYICLHDADSVIYQISERLSLCLLNKTSSSFDFLSARYLHLECFYAIKMNCYYSILMISTF